MKRISDDEILDIIKSAVGATKEEITMKTSMTDVPEWDSLAHLKLLVDLDAKFDGKVAEINEMATADSVPKIIDILKKYSLI